MSSHCVRLWLVVQLSLWLAYLGPGVPVALGGLDRTCGYTLRQNHVRHGICGSQLAELLRLVCTMHGLGYHGSSRKRRDVSQITPNDAPQGIARHLLSTRDARSFLQKRNVGQRGLICECCTHRCSMRELKEYCGPVQQPRPSMDLNSRFGGRYGQNHNNHQLPSSLSGHRIRGSHSPKDRIHRFKPTRVHS